MNKIYYTPNQIDKLIRELALEIRPHRSKFQRVVGIANGGLHISQPLAAMLHLPHYSVRISHYDGSTPREVPIVDGELPYPTGNLIVDDLIDDGFTMRTFDKYFGLAGNATAVLFCKPGGFVPDFFAAIKPNAWVELPWGDT